MGRYVFRRPYDYGRRLMMRLQLFPAAPAAGGNPWYYYMTTQ